MCSEILWNIKYWIICLIKLFLKLRDLWGNGGRKTVRARVGGCSKTTASSKYNRNGSHMSSESMIAYKARTGPIHTKYHNWEGEGFYKTLPLTKKLFNYKWYLLGKGKLFSYQLHYWAGLMLRSNWLSQIGHHLKSFIFACVCGWYFCLLCILKNIFQRWGMKKLVGGRYGR